jgi:hypothetical protein
MVSCLASWVQRIEDNLARARAKYNQWLVDLGVLAVFCRVYKIMFFSSEKPTSLTSENRPPTQFAH